MDVMNIKETSIKKQYSQEELVKRVRSLPALVHGNELPSDYWILGMQSKANIPDKFDDLFYLFKGDKLENIGNGTTNAGLTGLKSYEQFNPNGIAVIKTEEFYFNLWSYGLHRNKMPALRQIHPIKFYRDTNRDKTPDEKGQLFNQVIGINFHTVFYDFTEQELKNDIFRPNIGQWSAGCQVINHVRMYYEILNKVRHQDAVSYCLIKEF